VLIITIIKRHLHPAVAAEGLQSLLLRQ